MECPECGEELKFLDTIMNKITGKVEYLLYTCNNEECYNRGSIYNDRNGHPGRGDPSGTY